MKVWFLTVWILLNGTWVHGSDVPGWEPREQLNETVCKERMKFMKDTTERDKIIVMCLHRERKGRYQ